MLKGYSAPRTPQGRSSLVPAPPWHYVGDLLVAEFWADPAAAAAVLPAPLEPHPDGGRAAAIFVDWQSCSDSGAELVDPARSQYKEFFITVNALYEGEEVAYCPYIWVDRDFAMARGWIQGFPKKLGSIWVTRTFGLETAADPGIRAGSVFGGTCAAYERRLAEARVTLEGTSEGSAHTAPPIVNARHFPNLAKDRQADPAVHELVRSRGFDRSASETWEGSATLELFEAPGSEHTELAPVRVGRGYRFTVGYSVDDLETLTEL
jgi:acetoacetate decarboxylase